MFVRPFAILLLLAALVAPAWAQEQRGSIEGIVRDASGAVLPGATVEATSNVGQPASTVTDATGQFRFPSLAPGNYKVTANLQGFVAREVVDVRVALGQIKKVDFDLPLVGCDRNGAGDGGDADHRRAPERAPDRTSAPSRSSCCPRAATSRRW